MYHEVPLKTTITIVGCLPVTGDSEFILGMWGHLTSVCEKHVCVPLFALLPLLSSLPAY